MTPSRIKRNLKAPNRFSSDNSRIETSNKTGESVLDCNDSTSSSHNPAPTSKTTKTKPIMREPLKVKLPIRKRLPQSAQQTKEHTVKSNNSEIKIHKIKLPPWSSRKSTSTGDSSDHRSKAKSSSHRPQSLINMEQNNSVQYNSHPKSTSQIKSSQPPINTARQSAGYTAITHPGVNKSSSNSMSILDTSVANSNTTSEDKSISSANTSFSSSDDAEDCAPRMEIIVSEPEQSHGSGIRCPCGVDDDLGVIMVECEKCSTWQHGHCINVATAAEAEAYVGYVCAFCILPKDEARKSLHQLTIGDKFLEHFRILESLRKRNDDLNNNGKSDQTVDNAIFTPGELFQALKDLHRVVNSLRVKWRILTNPGYDQELRIWQNPFWSDDAEESLDKDKSIYFFR